MSHKSRRFQSAGVATQVNLDGELLLMRTLPDLGSDACQLAGQRTRVGRLDGWRGRRSPWHWRDRTSAPVQLLRDE